MRMALIVHSLRRLQRCITLYAKYVDIGWHPIIPYITKPSQEDVEHTALLFLIGDVNFYGPELN